MGKGAIPLGEVRTAFAARLADARRRRAGAPEFIWISLRESQKTMSPRRVGAASHLPMKQVVSDRLRDLPAHLEVRVKIVAAKAFTPSAYPRLSTAAVSSGNDGWIAWEILPYLTWLAEYAQDSDARHSPRVQRAVQDARSQAERFLRSRVQSAKWMSAEERAVQVARIRELFPAPKKEDRPTSPAPQSNGRLKSAISIEAIEAHERDREKLNTALRLPSAWEPLPPQASPATEIVAKAKAHGLSSSKTLAALEQMGLSGTTEAHAIRDEAQAQRVARSGAGQIRMMVSYQVGEPLPPPPPDREAEWLLGYFQRFRELLDATTRRGEDGARVVAGVPHAVKLCEAALELTRAIGAAETALYQRLGTPTSLPPMCKVREADNLGGPWTPVNPSEVQVLAMPIGGGGADAGLLAALANARDVVGFSCERWNALQAARPGQPHQRFRVGDIISPNELELLDAAETLLRLARDPASRPAAPGSSLPSADEQPGEPGTTGNADGNGGDTSDPALSSGDVRVLHTMMAFAPATLVSVETIAREMPNGQRLSPETIRKSVLNLIGLGFAQRPKGKRLGARLTREGRVLAGKIAD